jgi:hypothetical protein
MKKTNNLDLVLYESNDKFNITASENSLNANMKIIDEAIGNTVTTSELNSAISTAIAQAKTEMEAYIEQELLGGEW